MPEAVKAYVQNQKIEELKTVYSSLLTAYSEDVFKYSSLARAKYIAYVIENAPLFAGTAVTYEKFGGSHFRSREMSDAFHTLSKSMLLYQMAATKSKQPPLIEQGKRPKKLLFLDVGLVNHRMGIHENYLDMKALDDFYQGRIAEQVVGQNILAQFVPMPEKIFYWAKDSHEGSAEVDFCFRWAGKTLGIEVKSGTAARMRSLFGFAQEVQNARIMRVYSGMLKAEQIHLGGKAYPLLSIPFYLIPRILEA